MTNSLPSRGHRQNNDVHEYDDTEDFYEYIKIWDHN